MASAILPLTDDPVSNPEAWGVVYAAGVPSPGRAEVTGWSRDNAWDVKEPNGAQGATLTYKGQPAATGKIRLTVGYAEAGAVDMIAAIAKQFADLQSWVGLFAIDGTKGTTKGVAVRHPALMSLIPPVTDVVLKSQPQLEQLMPGDSLYECTLELIEYKEPSGDATQTANGSTQSADTSGDKTNSGGGDGPADDPVSDANQQEIADLQQKLQDTH